MEKGKYPPIENKIPTLSQWKRMARGQDHFSSAGEKESQKNEMKDQIAQLIQLKQAEIAAASVTTVKKNNNHSKGGSATTPFVLAFPPKILIFWHFCVEVLFLCVLSIFLCLFTPLHKIVARDR